MGGTPFPSFAYYAEYRLKKRGTKVTDTRLYIEGGRKISGSLSVHGAKNSVLPVLAATLLSPSVSRIKNCPALSDVYSSTRILGSLGCKCRSDKSAIEVDATALSDCEISESLMREMRSSIVFLGAILGRLRRCRLSFPGGCELGPRPIDIHISGLRSLGAKIIEDHGVLDCTLPGTVTGAVINLPLPSVGATENIMLAATIGSGVTLIHNAAREPEIKDLAGFINAMGGKISGAGSSTVTVEGVEKLHGAEFSVMPDRIVAATYMGAAAITGGELMLTGVRPSDMISTISQFEQMGCGVYPYSDRIFISAKKPLNPIKTVRTAPYPGFPTDCQPILMAVLTRARGTSVIVENIFENRFRAAPELRRLGADIKAEGRVAVVEGVPRLSGSPVVATDLRAGAALVLAGLAAEGTTTVSNINYIDRGYEQLEAALKSVGARIKRV